MPRKKKEVVMPEPERSLPSLYLHDQDIPKYLKDAKVGQKVKIVTYARVASRSESDGRYGSSKSISLDISKMSKVERKSPAKATIPKRKKR